MPTGHGFQSFNETYGNQSHILNTSLFVLSESEQTRVPNPILDGSDALLVAHDAGLVRY